MLRDEWVDDGDGGVGEMGEVAEVEEGCSLPWTEARYRSPLWSSYSIDVQVKTVSFENGIRRGSGENASFDTTCNAVLFKSVIQSDSSLSPGR